MAGKVVFVGAGPGDPDLITVRGLKALHAADVVFYDSLVDPSLLEGLQAQTIFVGKRRGEHSVTQRKINSLLAQQAGKGKTVVRLKGGDCSVFGRLGEELLYLVDRRILFEIVPGVTSATGAAIFAGIPVTHRGVADSFVVAAAHRGQDGLPISIPRYNPTTTVVLMMALATAEIWREDLLAQGYPEDLPVAYICAGGTPRQSVLVTTVEESVRAVQGAGLTTPVMAVVGQVVTLREKLQWFGEGGEASGEELALSSGC
jgi:uroporphyrin-III C-methyltransferase